MAIDTAHAFEINNNDNLAIDPSTHIVYQAYSAVTSTREAIVTGFHGV